MANNEIKKFCKLENGRIEMCYFPSGKMKDIFKQGDTWHITLEEYAHQMFFTRTYVIVAFADNWEDLR